MTLMAGAVDAQGAALALGKVHPTQSGATIAPMAGTGTQGPPGGGTVAPASAPVFVVASAQVRQPKPMPPSPAGMTPTPRPPPPLPPPLPPPPPAPVAPPPASQTPLCEDPQAHSAAAAKASTTIA